MGNRIEIDSTVYMVWHTLMSWYGHCNSVGYVIGSCLILKFWTFYTLELIWNWLRIRSTSDNGINIYKILSIPTLLIHIMWIFQVVLTLLWEKSMLAYIALLGPNTFRELEIGTSIFSAQVLTALQSKTMRTNSTSYRLERKHWVLSQLLTSAHIGVALCASHSISIMFFTTIFQNPDWHRNGERVPCERTSTGN